VGCRSLGLPPSIIHFQKDSSFHDNIRLVIYTRNHLFQGACLDIVNILLWYIVNMLILYLFSHCVSFVLLIIDFIIIFTRTIDT